MAHDLEISETGNVAFALRGEPAWHNLANKVFGDDEHVTTAEMLKSAFLSDWNVRLEEVPLPEGYRTTKDSFMVVRTNPFDNGNDVLSVVGERYHTYQNEQLFQFGDNLLDGGGAWESAGSIRDGRTVFGSLKLDREMTLDASGRADVTKTYLLVTTSHDGSSAIQAMTTPVRVVCQNTLNMALGSAKQSFKVRHTATAEGRVDQAKVALGLANAYIDEFEIMAQELIQTEITNQQWGEIIKSLYPEPDRATTGKASITKYDTKIDLLHDLYSQSPTQLNIKGTAWGALNALTERVDYFRLGRKGTNDGIYAGASGFDAQVNAEKGRILSAVKAVAGV
jgi:phage/plasmid-like protein (TIGR03299 family)